MEYQNDDERLLAEQAILNYRELLAVMKTAPHGKGMAVVEQAVREKGFEQMRRTIGLVINAHEASQKKGPTAGRASAEPKPTSSAARTNT